MRKRRQRYNSYISEFPFYCNIGVFIHQYAIFRLHGNHCEKSQSWSSYEKSKDYFKLAVVLQYKHDVLAYFFLLAKVMATWKRYCKHNKTFYLSSEKHSHNSAPSTSTKYLRLSCRLLKQTKINVVVKREIYIRYLRLVFKGGNMANCPPTGGPKMLPLEPTGAVLPGLKRALKLCHLCRTGGRGQDWTGNQNPPW